MRMRATVAGLTSRAAPMAASVQLGPASPWLAFSRMSAWVSALAGATPRPIMVCSQARSSSVRTTTCRLRTSASCSVGPPEPHEDEGQPPTTQLKADELLVLYGDPATVLRGAGLWTAARTSSPVGYAPHRGLNPEPGRRRPSCTGLTHRAGCVHRARTADPPCQVRARAPTGMWCGIGASAG